MNELRLARSRNILTGYKVGLFWYHLLSFKWRFLCKLESEFHWVGRILDSKALDAGVQSQKFSWILDSGWPYNGWVIASLRSVTVMFVFWELSIFPLCFEYSIKWLGNSSMLAFSLLWLGTARSSSPVYSRFCDISGNGRARPRFRS